MSKLEKKHILVVDDEEDVRGYLSMALEDAGFKVTTASDGFKAMEAVKVDKPDLISLDLVMPERSGAKFYQDIQKSSEFSDIPVIIVSGHVRDDEGKLDFEELTMSGVGVYLEKPVKPVSYVSAVCRVLEIDVPDDMLDDTSVLKGEINKSLENASVKELKRALDALKKN